MYLEEPIVVVHSQDFLAKLKVPAQILPNYQLLLLLPPLKLSSQTSVIGKPHRKARRGHKVKYDTKPIFKGFRI